MFDKVNICCQSVKYILIELEKFIAGKSNQLPSVHGIIRLFSLLDNVCFMPQVLVGFVSKLILLLKPIDQQLKQLSKGLKNSRKSAKKANSTGMTSPTHEPGTSSPVPLLKQETMVTRQMVYFTKTLALNCASVYRQYQTLFTLEAADNSCLQNAFDGFWSFINKNKPTDGKCFSSEMNIWYCLFEMWVINRNLLMKHIKLHNHKYPEPVTTIESLSSTLGWPLYYNNKDKKTIFNLVVDNHEPEGKIYHGNEKHDYEKLKDYIENPWPLVKDPP